MQRLSFRKKDRAELICFNKKKSKKKSKKKEKYENLSGDDIEDPEITEAEKQAILDELTSEFLQE